jgi:methionyl-tRNA formyltransferase
MRIVRALDAGPVADVETTPDRAGRHGLRGRAAPRGLQRSGCLQRNLPRLAAGTLVFTEQAHGSATYCRRLLKSDGVLDFTGEAADVAARINGLFPWPACSVDLGGLQVKLGLAVADEVDAGPRPARPASRLGGLGRGEVPSGWFAVVGPFAFGGCSVRGAACSPRRNFFGAIGCRKVG